MATAPKLFGTDRVYERWRWQVFAITWLAYAGFYLTRKSFSVAKIEMGEGSAVGLSSSEMSYIDIGYSVAYFVGQFVWGIAGDRRGPRFVVGLGMAGSIVAGFMMGVSNFALTLGIFFFIQGLCQSTGWAPLLKNVSSFFSRRERGVVMGVWCTNYAVGGLVASLFAGFCGDMFGYRYAFFGPALALAVIWVLFLALQRNRPEDVGLPPIEAYHGEKVAVLEEGERPEDEPDGSWKVIREVATNRMVLLLAAVYFLLKPTRYAILFWGPLYVSEKLGSKMAESGAISSLFELAGPLSVLLGGIASDYVFRSRRMPIAVICLLTLGVLLFFIDGFPATRPAQASAMFLIGLLLFAPDSMISGTAAIDFGTKKGASTAAGLINGAGSIGQTIGVAIPGLFKETWGWNGVFSMLGGSLLLAGLLLAPQWNSVPLTANGDAE